MKSLAFLAVPALVCVFFLTPAEGAKKKKKTASSTGDVAGTLVSITKGEGADATTTLTVTVPGAKKKAPPIERKFELTKGAKIGTLVVAKKAFELASGKLEDLKAGDRVVIQVKEDRNDQAERVMLVSATKKAKAAN